MDEAGVRVSEVENDCVKGGRLISRFGHFVDGWGLFQALFGGVTESAAAKGLIVHLRYSHLSR